jgi:hypothetical protein
MPDKYFLSASGADPTDPLGDERVLWRGHCAVAQYAFDEPASLPRWTLPEETEVVVSDQRVIFADRAGGGAGELRWPWPQHLRVQPGNRDTGRSATVTQIQLVCAGPAGSFPALVFAGGDMATVGDADRLANLLRQTIARYRVEHARELGLPMAQVRMLSRVVIGPEFSNYQGGEGQTVSLLGSVPVQRPSLSDAGPSLSPGDADLNGRGGAVNEPTLEVEPVLIPGPPPAREEAAAYQTYAQEPFLDEYFGNPLHQDAVEPEPAGWAPDLTSRAADLAARVANLVAGNAGLDRPLARYETETTNLSAFLNPPAADAGGRARVVEPDGTLDRAEQIRRTAARFAGNSARARNATPAPRPSADEVGAPAPSHRTT